MRFETTYDIPNEYLRLLFKGSFLFSSALLFFFFCFIICFSGVRKNRWISSDCEHWKSLIKKIAPKFVWTWSHAYSAWVIWTPVSHAQYIFQWFGKKPRSTDFSKRLTSATSIIFVSTLLHISKLKERVVFAQPNFHSSSSGPQVQCINQQKHSQGQSM